MPHLICPLVGFLNNAPGPSVYIIEWETQTRPLQDVSSGKFIIACFKSESLAKADMCVVRVECWLSYLQWFRNAVKFYAAVKNE